MRFSHFFVDRPIFAAVISIIVTLVGFISFRALPVAEYPEIAPPTVVVSTTFAGASAEVIGQTVAAPIEQEINGVDNMLYVVSQSTGNGALSINVVFKPGTNIDQAQVLVQNRVSVALPRLPEEVQRIGVTVRKSSPDLMLVIHLISPDGSLDGATFTTAPNAGVIFVTLKPFEERLKAGLDTAGILNDLRAQMASLREAFVLVIPPPSVPGIGTGGGFKLYVQDRAGRGPRALEQAVGGVLGPANRTPGLVQVFTLFNASTPRIYADIDRTKAEMLGVPISRFFDTLTTYMGSTFVNDFNILGRTYRVTAQADNPFRLSIRDVENLRTRSNASDMVPLGSVATFRDTTGPFRVPRYNLYPAAEIQGATLPGFSTGQAIGAMEKILANLPSGFGFEWTEIALQEKGVGNTAVIAFSLAVVFVFLLLAAQYESILLPLGVILIVPMCLLAAISGVLLRGMDNNVLTQIGFVVLIGLAAKNAILIVEFARQAEEHGAGRRDAAVQAARTRLRPILMTSFSFILGVVPLVVATGAGAEMRQALGTAVFYGMLGVTLFGLLFTPVFYVLVRSIGMLRQGSA